MCDGWGLFSLEKIEAGDVVATYTGELIDNNESDKRSRWYQLNEIFYMFLQTEENTIDAKYYGNKTRYINHSKDESNLEPRVYI